jgi:crotonobetainyl-CoA:carnitine CoA-transferase CaiB-like acyl-CoA transferase
MFKKLKIIEIAGVLAGPAVGMFFAELGAEVIKIENAKTGGDMTRKWKLPSENPNAKTSAYFSAVNYHKQYLFKDLSNPADQAEIHRLIKSTDVVLTNFKKGSDQKFKMDYETLSALNPGLIYASISGFDSNEDKVAFDLVLQAETGFMYMNGSPESGPVKMPVALIDVLAAHQLKEGILIALLKRNETGKGAHVSVSLEESALASLANQASNYLMAGHIPQRMGSLHPNIAPYGEILKTKDGFDVVLAVGTNHQFSALCKILEKDELIDDLRFNENNQRVKNRSELTIILARAVNEIPKDVLLDHCLKMKVPIAEIKNLEQVMKSPTAQKMILEETIDGEETKRLKTVAFRIED